MTSSDSLFTGSIPEVYDRYLVPLIFEAPARDLVSRLLRAEPKHVLETAAGTGALTRELASMLPASGSIVATDLNQAMLDHAATRLSSPGRLTWQKADALALPFEDHTFDAVACQFGIMFFPDKIQGCREAKRVLKPGGAFVFNVWDRIADNEFADVVTQVLATMFPKDPPTFLARTPHGYHDLAEIRQHLTAAGFALIEVDKFAATSSAPSARDVAIAYCRGTPLRHEIEARDPSRLKEATQKSTEALVRQFGSGAVERRIQAHVITAKV